MDPASSETRRNRSIGIALLGIALVIISADRLIDAWQDGQTWRVALYAVVVPAAIVATVYSVVHGKGD